MVGYKTIGKTCIYSLEWVYIIRGLQESYAISNPTQQ